MALSKTEKNRLRQRYGSWALVTGASSGIGKALAVRLAISGLNLVLVARRKPLLDDLANWLGPLYGIQIEVIEADLADEKAVLEVVERVKNLEIGLLVAAAGFGTSGVFDESDLAEEIKMANVNCVATMMLAQHFSRVFKSQKRGGLVLFSSLVAFQGVPFAAHYSATKAYVQTLAEGLAVELKPFGVDVLAVAPGPIETSFGDAANLKMNTPLKAEDISEPILRALGRSSTVVPGLLSKILTYSLRTVPRWAKIRIMKIVMGGMTAHQRKGA